MTTRVVKFAGDYGPNGIVGHPNYGYSLRRILDVSYPGDTVVFAAGIGTIDLMSELPVGANGVTIDGAIAGGGKVKIETLDGSTVLGLNGANVTLTNLIITQVPQLYGTDTAVGGLDIVGGTVSLDNLEITNNQAVETDPTETAGGIKVSGGADVTVTDSLIQDNIAHGGGSGTKGFDAVGGILVDGGTLHLVRTTIEHNVATGGEGGGTAYVSYRGGTGVGGLRIEGGGVVTADHASIYNNGGYGGLGGAGVTAVRGGIVGGHGGYGIGGLYVDNGTITAFSSSVTENDGTGGSGGRGGSPVGYSGMQSGPGESGSGGGAGGDGIGGAVVGYGSGAFNAYALDISRNRGHGGSGGDGGVGGAGVAPGSYARSSGTGGGMGGAPELPGGRGGGALGGYGGMPGQSGQAGFSPQVSQGIYSGGGGGGGGGGGIGITRQTSGAIQAIACFAAGTRIAVPGGFCAVEALQPGQMVLTQAGPAPVVWLGHRRIECGRHPRPDDVLPVCILPDAFGPGLPSRPLRLSPDHAVLIDGVLIPIRHLVNGATIRREAARTITYHHVELARHAVLLAEDLPCESYLDTGNRDAFANGGGALRMHADFARSVFARSVWRARACATLVLDGAELQAARSHLLWRAGLLGHETTTEADLRVVVDGQPIAPEIAGHGHRFRLPPRCGRVRLVSRVGAPAWLRDSSADWRPLGVAVAGIALDEVVLSRDDERLADGWHGNEPGWRWTDGNAGLACGEARVLDVTLVPIMSYWRDRAAQHLAVAEGPGSGARPRALLRRA